MTAKSLKESLADWTGFPKLGSSFTPRATSNVATGVTKLFQNVQPRVPKRYDLRRLYRRAWTIWQRNHSLAALRPRDLRQLPWVMFYPPRRSQKRWLGDKRPVVRDYGQWLLAGRRTRSVLALLHEFLRVYPTGLQTFDDLRKLLKKVIADQSAPPLPSLSKWQRRSAHHELLESDQGSGFVNGLLSATTPCNELLRDAGLDAELSRCGFLRSGIIELLPTCRNRLQHGVLPDEHLRRLLDLLVYNGRLRYNERGTRVAIAEGLLGPFVHRTPQAEIKQPLQSFFLRHFGDPRLPSGRHKWSQVPDDVSRVVTKWLVEQVLDQFFVLLKDTAFDKHWRYREAFWRAFHDEGLIDDICFVLGGNAAMRLRKVSKDPILVKTTGTLVGAQSDQSVLILRLPGVTIAEWSHNGSCHMWLDGMDGAPVLREKEYHVNQVRRRYPYPIEYGAYSQRHDGSATGRWQDAIALWLRKNTDLKIDRELYFPRRLRRTPKPRGTHHYYRW